ncbi:hypothetical protein [Parathermosynechococcus lividus]
MDNKGVNKAGLYTHCKTLAQEFDVAKKLNSAARQARAEQAWASISRFYTNCKTKEARLGAWWYLTFAVGGAERFVVVYENLQVKNLVKNRHRANSIRLYRPSYA